MLAKRRAELLTVVNMANEAPSDPSGQRCVIMRIVGRNWIPLRKSPKASSIQQKKEEDFEPLFT